MRIIDADELINVFNVYPDKYGTAIFLDRIIEIINEQPTVEPDKGPNEIVITQKAWDELPEDLKARMIKSLRSSTAIVGIVQS